MNTTLATDRRHEQSIHYEQHAQPVRRVGAFDRAALHLGIALIKWGRRPLVAAEYERRATRLERALAQHQRVQHIEAERDRVRLDHALISRVR